MSRGYKRRKKAIAAGTYETPGQRSARVMGEFVANVQKAIEEMRAIPPEKLAKMREAMSEETVDESSTTEKQ